jgi:prevent-host-death family protein
MAEQMKSITDARQNLPGLSQSAQEHMERYIITNQGQPQSVLVGYSDYQQIKAVMELARRPEAVADIQEGLRQMRSGQRLTTVDLLRSLRDDPPTRLHPARNELPVDKVDIDQRMVEKSATLDEGHFADTRLSEGSRSPSPTKSMQSAVFAEKKKA